MAWNYMAWNYMAWNYMAWKYMAWDTWPGIHRPGTPRLHHPGYTVLAARTRSMPLQGACTPRLPLPECVLAVTGFPFTIYRGRLLAMTDWP